MKYDTAANFCLIALGSYDVKCKSPLSFKTVNL